MDKGALNSVYNTFKEAQRLYCKGDINLLKRTGYPPFTFFVRIMNLYQRCWHTKRIDLFLAWAKEKYNFITFIHQKKYRLKKRQIRLIKNFLESCDKELVFKLSSETR